jgi:hypothetical protein
MPNIVTSRIKFFTADQIVESVSESANTKLYLFIGRPYTWNNENIPETPVDIEGLQYQLWDSMIGMKRISATDTENVTRRINWRKFSVYTPFDDRDPKLYEKPFYVLTGEYRVYKCIDNYNGAQSLYEPSSTSFEVFTTSDGYKWKYMYTIGASDQLRFLTRNWMPVLTDEEVKANALDGSVERIAVVQKGSGYTVPTTSLTIVGDGNNLNVSPIIVNNSIESYNINNKGFLYRFANIKINSTNGTGAVARPIISPKGGHGFDPVSELGAFYVMINGRLVFEEGAGDIPIGVDYRTIGIIKDPLLYNNTVAENITLNTNFSVNVINVTGTFSNDEFITSNISLANAYIVVSKITGTNRAHIRYIQAHNFTNNFIKPSVGERITGMISGATGVIRHVYDPEVKHDTGDIIYVENLTKIDRTADQSEIVHMIIKF